MYHLRSDHETEESTRSRREEDKSETGSVRERNRETEGGERDKETKTKSMVALFSISLFCRC